MTTSARKRAVKNPGHARMLQLGLSRALAKRGGTIDKGIEAVCDACVALAIDERNLAAMQEIMNRFGGKPTQTVEQTVTMNWEMMIQHLVAGRPLELHAPAIESENDRGESEITH